MTSSSNNNNNAWGSDNGSSQYPQSRMPQMPPITTSVVVNGLLNNNIAFPGLYSKLTLPQQQLIDNMGSASFNRTFLGTAIGAILGTTWATKDSIQTMILSRVDPRVTGMGALNQAAKPNKQAGRPEPIIVGQVSVMPGRPYLFGVLVRGLLVGWLTGMVGAFVGNAWGHSKAESLFKKSPEQDNLTHIVRHEIAVRTHEAASRVNSWATAVDANDKASQIAENASKVQETLKDQTQNSSSSSDSSRVHPPPLIKPNHIDPSFEAPEAHSASESLDDPANKSSGGSHSVWDSIRNRSRS